METQRKSHTGTKPYYSITFLQYSIVCALPHLLMLSLTVLTYRQLFDQTCRLANVLKKRGINKGDVVVICMPTMPLAVASMLACARIGAVHWYI